MLSFLPQTNEFSLLIFLAQVS